MPTSKHFFKRQYWQLLRVKGVISHFSSLAHLWFIPWVMHLLKNPCNETPTNLNHTCVHVPVTNGPMVTVVLVCVWCY